MPRRCPSCGNVDIQPLGRGGERLEEHLAGLLAEARRPDGGPVRIARLALVEDSDGAGRFRGGLGLRKDFRFDRPTTFTVLADRTLSGPAGAFGGLDGRVAEYVLLRDGVETPLGAKSTVSVEAGDVVSYRTCGGGGYGPPSERDPELVLRDVLEEKVSVERARDVYRVAIRDRRVDVAATAELRA